MKHASSNDRPDPPRWLEVIATRVESLRFGSVQITVHDGKVVQIDHTERLRIHANGQNAVQSESP